MLDDQSAVGFRCQHQICALLQGTALHRSDVRRKGSVALLVASVGAQIPFKYSETPDCIH
jgi:hypothetical protein